MQIKQLLTTAVSVSVLTTGLVASNSSFLSSLIGNMTPTAHACTATTSTDPCAVNTATVNSVTQDIVPSNDSATVSDVLCQSNDISSTTTDSKITINPLATNAYVVTVTNAGPSTLTKIDFSFGYNDTQLVDPTSVVPSAGTLGTAVLTGSAATRLYSNSLSGLSVAAGGTVTLTFNTSVPGPAVGTIVVNFDATPIDERSITTYPYLSVCPAVDPSTLNNASTDNNTVINAQADLSLVKTSTGGSSSITNAQGQFIKGTTGSYTLTATNNGPSIAGQPITIVDTMPSQLTYTGYSGTNWTCNAAGTAPVVVTCTNPNNLANGASSAVVLNVSVNL
jgi:uncharacterized repeat protein (TIGR01451 family)